MKNKIVWLAEWDNGQDYEDRDREFVGIYSTQEKAETNAKEYHEKRIAEGGTYNPGSAEWYVYRVEVDK